MTRQGKPEPVTMPRYRSHKIVEAARVVGVSERDGSKVLHLATGHEIVVSTGLGVRLGPGPSVGGYFVRYADGFESWSPRDVFEEGYTLVEEPRGEKAGEE